MAKEKPQDNRQPTVSFDWRDYLHHLEDHDLTEAQKAELIIAMAQIIAGFIDFGFGIAPGQRPVDETADEATHPAALMVKSRMQENQAQDHEEAR